MGNILSITKNGKLKRADNSLIFIFEDGRKIKLPVMKVTQIDIYSNVSFTSEILYFLNLNNIGINFFHHFSFNHFGEFNMWNKKGSEKLLFSQIKEQENKLEYIKEFYKGIKVNLIFLLSKYQKRADIGSEITKIMKDIRKIDLDSLDSNYLLVEALIWNNFYKSIPLIVSKKEFLFTKRTRRPPEDKINALISFINTKLYFTVNGSINSTKLDNRIGFIHALTDNSRFSLALDIAELFKPIFTFYFIFLIINNKKITDKDFENDYRLSKDGLNKINKLYFEFLEKKVYHPKLKRMVSYKYLIKIECYKLIKKIYNDIEYKSIDFSDFK